MIGALAWLGARAHWMLVGGITLAFVAPEVSRLMRPALPWLVPAVLGLAMARLDLPALARSALRPRAALGLVAVAALLMPVSAAVYVTLADLAGLDAETRMALVYLAAAPPIASAANLCFLLGYDGRRALEVTVAAMLLTPILGPLTVAAFLAGAAPIGASELALKLGLMIAGGVAVGLGLRRIVGAERIAREARAFDGLAILALITFVIPLFDGVPALIRAAPGQAALTLAVATLGNLGVNLALRGGLARVRPAAEAGAYGVLFGNRTIAIYLAALPFDPRFAVFVALYQVPMLLTPLLLRAILSHTRN